jgi:hypothetical protein
MTDIAKLATWFAGNDTGVSSCTIAASMAGANMDNVHSGIPHDPGDLGRCLRLLEIFPEWKSRMPEMANLSKDWAKLMHNWDDIVQCMEGEVGINWSKGREAPKTYDLMKSIAW